MRRSPATVRVSRIGIKQIRPRLLHIAKQLRMRRREESGFLINRLGLLPRGLSKKASGLTQVHPRVLGIGTRCVTWDPLRNRPACQR